MLRGVSISIYISIYLSIENTDLLIRSDLAGGDESTPPCVVQKRSTLVRGQLHRKQPERVGVCSERSELCIEEYVPHNSAGPARMAF